MTAAGAKSAKDVKGVASAGSLQVDIIREGHLAVALIPCSALCAGRVNRGGGGAASLVGGTGRRDGRTGEMNRDTCTGCLDVPGESEQRSLFHPSSTSAVCYLTQLSATLHDGDVS